jgi:hypothetical protein
MSSGKIRPEHLGRTAFVYVRQSTLDQVRHHHESRRRQYDLADHARRLGWTQLVVIDDDLGKSGATAAGRGCRGAAINYGAGACISFGGPPRGRGY